MIMQTNNIFQIYWKSYLRTFFLYVL